MEINGDLSVDSGLKDGDEIIITLDGCGEFQETEYGMTAICEEDVVTVHAEGVELFLGGKGIGNAVKLKNRLLLEVDADEMIFKVEGLEERIY